MSRFITVIALTVCFLAPTLDADAYRRGSYRKNRKHRGLKFKKKKYLVDKVVRKKKKKIKTQKRGPMKASSFQRFTKQRILSRLQGQIKTLNEIIQQTPKRLRADLYYRLAEHYWEVAKYYDFVGHKYDDYRGRPEWPEKKRLQAQSWSTAKLNRRKAAAEYYRIIRGYPNFKRLCESYFFLGKNLFDMGQEKPALKVFRSMIKKFASSYPKCPFIPNAYLAFGEHYFNNNQVRTALGSYQQVLHFRNATIYAFAMYKVAWCYYNLVRYRKALKTFIQVVQHARNATGRWGSAGRRLQLLKEALRDLVLAYSKVGSAENARSNFYQWGGEGNYLKMMSNLGGLYREQGKNHQIIKLYSELMNLQSGSPKTLKYQLYITMAVDRTQSKQATIRSVDKLVRMVQHFRKADPKNKFYVDAIKEIQPQIKEFATFRHYEGQRTRRPHYLAEALQFYRAYLQVFSKGKDALKMRFFYAELLYNRKKYEKAAQQYTRVLKMNPKSKYALDSAYNPVLAYQFLMKQRGLDVTNVGSKKGKSITKKPLQPIAKRFLKACETFLTYFPKGNRAIDVSYKAAQLYYFYNHFQKANKRFFFLVKKFPTHEYAIYSAHYILDVYNIQKKWVQLNKWAWKFYKMPGLGNPKFKQEVRDLIVQSGMKTCEGIEGQKQYAQAASCYCKFANEFPDKKRLAAIATYNCSINRFKAGNVEKALMTRRRFLKNYENYKNSRVQGFVKKSILDLAGVYAQRANFYEASRFYEKYLSKYKRDRKKRGKALAAYYDATTRAGRFREANGEMPKAIDHFNVLLKDEKFRKKHRKEYVAIYFRVAKYYKKNSRSRYARMMKAAYDWKYKRGRKIRRYIPSGLRIHARMEYAMMQRKKKREKILRGIPRAYERLSEVDKKKYPKAGYAAAYVRFKAAEELFKEYAKIRLSTRMNKRQMGKTLKKKDKALNKAFKAYQKVVKYRQGHWGVAALYRAGDISLNYSKFLYKAPTPSRKSIRKEAIKQIRKVLSRRGIRRYLHSRVLRMPRMRETVKNIVERITQKYKDTLQERARPYEDTAVKFYIKALRLAYNLSVYNVWTQRSLVRLSQLRPYDYPKPIEAMPRVGFSGSDFSFSTQIMGEPQQNPAPTPMPKKKKNVAIKPDLSNRR